jgi:predicted phosphoadenosine phosphosulfate sulfurtransferase
MTNSLSPRNNFLYTWAPEARDRWIRDQDPISVKENPVGIDKLFHPVVKHCPLYCGIAGRKHAGVLVGMRMQESLNRRTQLMYNPAGFKGITWAHKVMIGNTRTFWPLYDWGTNDVWTAIGRNHWTYNKVYDFMYQAGVTDMRVSSLIHETAWKNILLLQEFEPKLYDRYLTRVNGVSCFTHFGRDMTPKRLPEVFCSWKEYRDYLLEHLIEPHYQPLFAHRWKGQDDLKWYKVHINEIMANDIDGTINRNHRSRVRVLARATSNFYKKKDEELFARLKITP